MVFIIVSRREKTCSPPFSSFICNKAEIQNLPCDNLCLTWISLTSSWGCFFLLSVNKASHSKIPCNKKWWSPDMRQFRQSPSLAQIILSVMWSVVLHWHSLFPTISRRAMWRRLEGLDTNWRDSQHQLQIYVWNKTKQKMWFDILTDWKAACKDSVWFV